MIFRKTSSNIMFPCALIKHFCRIIPKLEWRNKRYERMYERTLVDHISGWIKKSTNSHRNILKKIHEKRETENSINEHITNANIKMQIRWLCNTYINLKSTERVLWRFLKWTTCRLWHLRNAISYQARPQKCCVKVSLMYSIWRLKR